MLRVYLPQEDPSFERTLRLPCVFKVEITGDVEKHGDKIVWAVADGTAEDFADRVQDYRKYDWSKVSTLCFGGNEESLVHSGKIKDHHDLVTIPQTTVSMMTDQALAILLAHYVTVVPDEEREAKVRDGRRKIQELRRKNRKQWLNRSTSAW